MKTIAESIVQPSYKKDRFIYVHAKDWDLFPARTTMLELETDKGPIKTQFYVGSYRGFSRKLKPWFKAHPELQPGDKLLITVREPMKKYRLELLK